MQEQARYDIIVSGDFNLKKNFSGCILCGANIVYSEIPKEMTCENCGKTFVANAWCENGHFLCDACHMEPAFAVIKHACLTTRAKDPVSLAIDIMENKTVNMHGPEHHFLVPAVLLTAIHNEGSISFNLEEKLSTAMQRAKNVPGGFCGFYGACGAGIGAGIFISVFLAATPLSEQEWSLANEMTSACLSKIALLGGPRCCKRDVFATLETAVSFISEKLHISLPCQKPVCSFFPHNRECKVQDCPYFAH